MKQLETRGILAKLEFEKMITLRDFIKTKDKLYFAVTSYFHPKDRFIAFLRYRYHDKNRRYLKISSTGQSFEFLEEKFPLYVFFSEVTNSKLQCVPREKVLQIYHPTKRLREIYEKQRDYLEEKALKISEIFSEIPIIKKGVTGSLLINMHDKKSDIDFVIYGTKEHEKARDILKGAFEDGSIKQLNKREWMEVYKKRFIDHETLSFEEFLRHEERKYHKGIINDTIFDILLVRDDKEINEKYGDKRFKRIKKIKAICKVTDSSLAFDFPAIYRVEGENNVKEVVSFTHTYAGQTFEGEEIKVCGLLEEVRGKENYNRIVVGTTREAKGEYIKVIRFL